MNRAALLGYALTVTILLLKYVALISVQRSGRMRSGRFRWAEDVRAFGGAGQGDEHPLVERAQAALRNDGESQPVFLALSGLWVAAGAEPALVAGVGGSYALLRCAHSALLLWPRQPARTRVFGVSLLLMLAVLVDTLRRLVLTP